MTEALWKDPKFQEWERKQVPEEPVCVTEYRGLLFARYRSKLPVYPMLSFKDDSLVSDVDEMEAYFSTVKQWNYGDVL